MKNGELTEYKAALTAAIEGAGLDSVIKPLSQEIYLLDTYIAGTARLRDSAALNALKVGGKLILIREESKFDSHAIGVCSADGKRLGYVPERDEPVLARLMDAEKLLIARVSGIAEKGGFKQVAIGIYLVDF